MPNSITDTHDRILDYLKENRTANVPGLSRLWGLTRADIRYHIRNLLQEGFIQLVPKEKGSCLSRGRPVLEYRLTSQNDIGNYQDLCAALLALLMRDDVPQAGFERIKFLAETMAAQPIASTTLTQQLNIIVKWLNQRGYHSRWEASAAGPLLMFTHCPYAAILPNHPYLCKLDQAVLQYFLPHLVEQKTRMNFQSRYPRACLFQIASNSDEP